MASWRPLYRGRGAVKIIGSPFKSFDEAEVACEVMLKLDECRRGHDRVLQQYERIERLIIELNDGGEVDLAACKRTATLNEFDEATLARCRDELKRFDPDNAYVDCDRDDGLRPSLIAERMALLVDSKSKGRPPNPQVYAELMMQACLQLTASVWSHSTPPSAKTGKQNLTSAAVALLTYIDPDDVDCLVIDYKMPHMDGLEVAVRLRQRNIAAPIVLITGYPDQHIAEKAAAARIDYILFKPHLQDSLVTCVRMPSLANAKGIR